MELAVEEMRKSRSEHENKYDPLVGAVLVRTDGEILGKAHRGALRVGDHAEFTLLERKFGAKDLEGGTLYVTLEPCTVREPPKVTCANRIIAARLKRVFIGMLDPNPDIEGHGVAHLQRNGIEVDFFDVDLWQVIRKENQDFVEQYEKAEEPLPAEEEREGPSEKEKEIIHAASLDDFAAEVIQDYVSLRKEKFAVPSAELWTHFHKCGFVVKGDKDGTYTPTVAGLLLFGRRPEDFLVQSKVKVEVHTGTKTKAEDIAGPLLSVPDRIKAFLEQYGPTRTVIRDFKRLEEPDYPWEAIREALMNALVHRDYQEGAHVFLQVYKDRFVIRSPGLPLKPVSLAKIRAYNAPPFSRNPRLADTFVQMRLMEERGWGLPRMRDILVSNGLPPPQFSIDSTYFVVTFPARLAEQTTAIAPEILARLDERQGKIAEFTIQQGSINRAQCASLLAVSLNTATRELNKLVKLSVLEPRGKGRAKRYVLVPR
jgi:ATP-dependent DNA helicase RecG